jgi:hypothetical protein
MHAGFLRLFDNWRLFLAQSGGARERNVEAT